MTISQVRTWFSYIGLCVATGVLLLSVKYFVMNSGFYDMQTTSIKSDNWLLDMASFIVSAASSFVAYRLLARNHTCLSLWEGSLITFLGFGGLLCILGTMTSGWQLSGAYFLYAGVEATVLFILVAASFRGIAIASMGRK